MIPGNNLEDNRYMSTDPLIREQYEQDLLDQEDLEYFKESKGFKNLTKTKLKNDRYERKSD